MKSLNPTAAFKVDFCGKTSGAVGVVQRAEDGHLRSRHSEQHHQDGTQNVALHHFHRLVELLQEQSLTLSGLSDRVFNQCLKLMLIVASVDLSHIFSLKV